MSLSISLAPTAIQVGRFAAPPAPPPTALSLRGGNGDLIIAAGTGSTTDGLIIEVVEPAAYAGSYQVDWADLADGVHMLAPPVVTGPGLPGTTLTGLPGLWAYDPAVYGTVPFELGLTWLRNGVPVALATAADYAVTAADEGATLNLLVSAPRPDGTAVTAASAAVAVPSRVVDIVRFTGAQHIDIAPALADLRALSFGMRLRIDSFAGPARLVANADPTLAMGVQVGTAGGLLLDADAAGYGITALSVTNGYLSATVPDLAITFSADLNRHGSDIRLSRWHRNGTGGTWSAARTSTVAVPAGIFFNSTALRAFRNGDGTNAVLSVHGFLWIADRPVTADALRDALFETVDTAADPTGLRPRILPANGAITVGGVEIVPRVFLTGPNFGQFQDGGTWYVPNQGSAGGNLVVVGGPL